MYDEELEFMEESYIEISKENNQRGRVLEQIKERLHQELLNNLSGLENVDGKKLLEDLLEIFDENDM